MQLQLQLLDITFKMDEIKVNHKSLFIAFIIILAISQFFLLDRNPMQPWDEAIYATRIDYAIDENKWLDQTEGSVEGMYSSSHPPL